MITERIMDERCRGCYMVQKYETHYCFLYDLIELDFKDFDCPCFNCLVKVICRTSCDDVNEYFDYLRDERKKKNDDTM